MEPSTSTDTPSASNPSLSPHASSSSDSFNSSRPNSQGSSATSRSVSSSPVPKSVPATDSEESFELQALPSIPSLPNNVTASNSSHQNNDPPRSVPPIPAASPGGTSHEASWTSRLRSLIPTKNWLTNALGAISLGVTLIGLFVYGKRTYKLALWSAEDDARANCIEWNSVSSFIFNIAIADAHVDCIQSRPQLPKISTQ